MSLSVVTAVCGAMDITKRFLAETMGSTSNPRRLCVAFNGCTDDEICSVLEAYDGPISVIVDPEPTGSAQALNRAVSVATGDVVAILHNDLLVHQPGWDVELERFFQDNPDAGVVGFAGARVLGRDDIYRAPYELVQLARGDVWTSLEDWEAHGRQAVEPVRVAVLDGLAICCRRETFESLGGFDELIGVHHMYDIDLSLRFLDAGFTNYVIPVRARHVSGQTANGPRYQARFGPDTETHRTAHENFYRKHLNRLPVRV